MCARINIPSEYHVVTNKIRIPWLLEFSSILGLMVQDMTPCQGPADPNAPAHGQENEGNAPVAGFWGPSSAASVSTPLFEPDPTFNSNPNPYVPYVPVCNWSCRKSSATAPIRICDEIGGLYTSDCDFYKAVCRAELRGYLLRRTRCARNVNTLRQRKVNWV